MARSWPLFKTYFNRVSTADTKQFSLYEDSLTLSILRILIVFVFSYMFPMLSYLI